MAKDNIDVLFSLFEWAFDLEFSLQQKNRIRKQINTSLKNDDSSDEELLLYIRKIDDLLSPEARYDRNQYKTKVVELLQPLLDAGGSNDLAKIMLSISGALKEQHKIKMREIREMVERERNVATSIIGDVFTQHQDSPSQGTSEVQNQILDNSINDHNWITYLNRKTEMEYNTIKKIFW
jgi:hypothetical protein